MDFRTAKHYAEKLVTWLSPYCERLEIAGSVRRERPVCNDIDLVCVPKLVQAPNDLLGQADGPPTNLLREFLMDYVAKSGEKAWFRSTAGIPGRKEDWVHPTAVVFLLQLPKCKLDIFSGTEDSFITRLVSRTGSSEHNIWIAGRAKRMGGALDPQNGLWMDGKAVKPKTEEEFYSALKLPFIPPAEREIEILRRRFGG